MPRQLVQPEIDQGRLKLLPVASDEFMVKVQLTTRDFGKLPPACRDMIAHIKAICASLENDAG